MALKDDLLPLIDDLRAIPGDLGFRPYEVWIRVTTYGGPRVGEGVASVSETRFLVGSQNPKVREIKSKDIVLGYSEIQSAVFEIGPLTPEFSGGGVSYEAIAPEHSNTPTTIHFIIKGPGLPTTGLLCQRIEDDLDRPLRMIIRVKSSGVAA